MRSIVSLRSALLIGALGLAGCGKSNTHAKVPLESSPAPTTAPAVAAVAKPSSAVVLPEVPRPGPSFLPDPTVPAPTPIPTVQPTPAEPTPTPPVPTPVPVPVPVPQPPTPNPNPTPPPEPAPTPPTDPKTPPKPIEYPKQIDGKSLTDWLKEIAYYPSSYTPMQADPQSREIAIKVLPNFGPDARSKALNPLILVVERDSDPGVRQAAITVISNMGYEDEAKARAGALMAKNAVRVIQTRLASTAPGSAERLTCVRSLASFGSDAVGSAKSMRDICKDPSYETRIAIANALGRVGMAPDETSEANKEAATALLDHMIVDVCASVRMEAIQSLLILGPPRAANPAAFVRAVEPYLKAVAARVKPEAGKVGEKDKNVLCWLLLLQIMYDGSHMDANVKQLAQFVKAPEGPNVANLRTNAMNALAVLGPKAVGALDVIIDALHYEDPYLVASAISCLAPMGTSAVKAIPELEKIAAGSKDPQRPKDAPKEWKPDQTLRNLAKEALEYVKGTKKIGVPEPKEVPKN